MQNLKIAIACPRGVKTGGPEALHQLCHELIKWGTEAFLINTGTTETSVSEYEKYNAPWRTVEELTSATHLVVPETVLEIPEPWHASFSGEVIVWWLSVDNSSFPDARNYESKKHPLPQHWYPSLSAFDTVKAYLTNTLNFLRNPTLIKNSKRQEDIKTPAIQFQLANCSHIAQSVYAQTWVSGRFGKQTHLVSDYIWRDNPIAHTAPIARAQSKNQRQLIVAFNPARGAELVEMVRKSVPTGVKFIALKGMSGQKVSETLSRADVYLDLGHFPGRDRTPREAALSNCPILISLRGSARYHGDFSVDDFYRVDLELNGPEVIASRLYEIASNKHFHATRQALFRDTVTTAKQRFSQEVKAWLDYLKMSRKGMS